jgi:hypothetical protein
MAAAIRKPKCNTARFGLKLKIAITLQKNGRINPYRSAREIKQLRCPHIIGGIVPGL